MKCRILMFLLSLPSLPTLITLFLIFNRTENFIEYRANTYILFDT